MINYIPKRKNKVLVTAQIDEDLYNEAKIQLAARKLKIKDIVDLAFKNFVESCKEENRKKIK